MLQLKDLCLRGSGCGTVGRSTTCNDPGLNPVIIYPEDILLGIPTEQKINECFSYQN